jgi:hypothetical protein
MSNFLARVSGVDDEGNTETLETLANWYGVFLAKAEINHRGRQRRMLMVEAHLRFGKIPLLAQHTDQRRNDLIRSRGFGDNGHVGPLASNQHGRVAGLDDEWNGALAQSSADGRAAAVAEMEIDDGSREVRMLGDAEAEFHMPGGKNTRAGSAQSLDHV